MDLPRHVLVLGFRRTGQAVAAALAARGVGVRAADARPAAALGVTGAPAGVELRLGEDGPALLAGVELVVPSPGVGRVAPVLATAVRRGIAVRSEIELAFRLLSCPLVAITGTNGKSTTTSLIGLALERAGRRTFTGGNLGTPLIAALDLAPEVAVAEVSSFQLEWVERFRPRVGCLLNVTPDHLDRHASFAEYREAKARLFAAQEAQDFAVVNRDDPEAWRAVAGVRARIVSFGAGAVPCGAFAGEGFVALRLPDATEERYGLGRTRLAGRHNVENILAAVTAARLAGAPPAAVQAAIDEIEPLPHRLARVAERGGVVWYDDSKATNGGAAGAVAPRSRRSRDRDGRARPGRRRSAGLPRCPHRATPAPAGGARRRPVARARGGGARRVERRHGLQRELLLRPGALRGLPPLLPQAPPLRRPRHGGRRGRLAPLVGHLSPGGLPAAHPRPGDARAGPRPWRRARARGGAP